MKLKEQLERKINAEGKSIKTFETYWTGDAQGLSRRSGLT